jgi:hypothetical protein
MAIHHAMEDPRLIRRMADGGLTPPFEETSTLFDRLKAGCCVNFVLDSYDMGPHPAGMSPSDPEPPEPAAAAPAALAATIPLSPAEPAEVASALAYGLCFDERGRPRRGMAWEMAATLLAEQLVQQLERANFVVLKRPPRPPHST